MILLLLSIIGGIANHGSSLYFDTDSSYIQIPQSSSLDLDTFTIEGWFKVDTLKEQRIFQLGDYDNYTTNIVVLGTEYYGTYGIENCVLFAVVDNTPTEYDLTSDNDIINAGKWYYFCIENVGDSMFLWVDTLKYVKDKGNSNLLRYSGYSYIGWSGNNSDPKQMKGYVKQIRVYNRILSEQEIRWNIRNVRHPYSTAGLRLWLKMNEFGNDTCYDYSGYGLNGVLVNTPQWSIETVR